MLLNGLDPRRHSGLLWRILNFCWDKWSEILGVRRDFLVWLREGVRV